MKYLCIIYNREKNLEGYSREQWAALKEEYGAFTGSIKASGHHLAGAGLQQTPTAKTVRVRDGKVSTTDGPFAETTEQLGGFYLIEARDLNDAIQVSSRIPSARMGSIEVRPILEFNT
jgi:hypothetical protein